MGYTMRFACSIASAGDAEETLEKLLLPIDSRLTPGMVDLVLFFTTGHFTDEVENVVEGIYANFPNAIVIGCTADGTIGHDKRGLAAGSVVPPKAVRRAELTWPAACGHRSPGPP